MTFVDSRTCILSAVANAKHDFVLQTRWEMGSADENMSVNVLRAGLYWWIVLAEDKKRWRLSGDHALVVHGTRRERHEGRDDGGRLRDDGSTRDSSWVVITASIGGGGELELVA